MLMVFGLLFIIRGISQGDGGQVAVGIPGLLVGVGAVIFYKVGGDQPRGRR
jgi:hypothetical protein